MAAFARGKGFSVEESTFEDWEPGDRAFDALVAGLTWHWVDDAAGAAKAKRVLRPTGRVAIFWNAGDAPTEVTEAFAAAFATAIPDSPMQIGSALPPADQLYTTLADRAAEGFRQVGGFAEAERWQDSWDQPYTREAYLAMLPTQGLLTRATANSARRFLRLSATRSTVWVAAL